MEKTPNYSPAQESIIRDFVPTGPEGRLTMADATAIAALPGMLDNDGQARKPRSIVAKIGRMNLPYAKAEKSRKDGSAVESKAKLVEQISAAAGVTFENLTNAARGDLVKLRDFVRKAA